MSVERIKKIAVIGAGTMGHGIAEVAALSGYDVWIVDVAEEFLKNAMEKIKWSVGKLYEKGQIKESVETIISRVHPTLSFDEALVDADFIIEAVPEKIELKKEIFSKLDEKSPKHAILATNTSSLPISEIAEATKRAEKVIGMHFFNPPVLMPLVEVIKGDKTSEETVNVTYELAKKFGKQAVLVNKDVPGFIVNRILFRIFNVACWIVESKKADILEVDATARYKLGFPMGVFELADYSGIDVGYLVSKAMSERGYSAHPCVLFEEKYRANELGMKTGKGFYSYPAPGKYSRPEIPKEKAEKLDPLLIIAPAINEAAWLLREGVASRDDIDKACKLGLGYPKGVLEYADEYGIDNVVKALEYLRDSSGWFGYSPDPLLLQMVKEGKLGRKSGRGFYEYGLVEEKKLSTLILKLEPPLVWIVLNRPERLNAINIEMLKELSNTLDELEEDERARVVILTGSGRAFSAGADVTAFTTITPFKAAIYSRKFQEVLNKIEYYTKPVIVAINGFALGGGLEMAMSGDIRIASETAQLGQPEINLGLMPGAGGTQRLSRLVGSSRAKEIIFTGDMISAKEALEIGLVNKVVAPEKLEEEARRIALKIAEKPPLALLAAKHAVNVGLESNIWAGLAYESSLFGLLFSTEDFIEGVSSFLEKRKPKFKGK